ncbi:MAG TPA: gluconeogenesis factor YvcK family protein, partial [Coriobacteriia bacterium]
MTASAKRAVAIGGGTGLPKVLWCLLEMGLDTMAVVTMADDGGSSGHLRRELGMLPPGDARNCLVAMAADPDSSVAAVFSYRFPHGEGLAGHALGNLVIAALADIEGSFPAALDAVGRLLGSRGRVVPS